MSNEGPRTVLRADENKSWEKHSTYVVQVLVQETRRNRRRSPVALVSRVESQHLDNVPAQRNERL